MSFTKRDEHERRMCPRAGEVGHYGCGVCHHGKLYADCAHCLTRRANPGLDSLAECERDAVRRLGEQIGYGRTMQLCEELWNEHEPKGHGHSVGPCLALLTPCACVESEPGPASCNWCCGTGRVTQHVRILQGLLP
jgi:hypothetical protein